LSRPIAEFVRQPRTLVLAHRGASAAAPENTLPAFSAALALGVDFVELDYLHSADGVPVVFHDDTLDRTTDAVARWGGKDIPFATKTLEELRQLDAGGWVSPQFAGTRLATLEEALALICRDSRCMIERKSGDAKTCVDLLRRLGVVDRVVLTSFDWQFLAECHALAPELVLGALGDKTLTAEMIECAKAAGASILGWDDKLVTREHVELVHRHELRAWVWTVDDAARAQELIGFGVDGLISNCPDKMLAAKNSNAEKTLITVATYNEIDNLPGLVEEIFRHAPQSDLLVIDDNSPDGTGRWCDEQSQKDPRLKVLHRTGKLGLGTAIVAGMRYAIERGYKYALNIDADFSHHPKYLPDLIGGMDPPGGAGADVMIGSRYIPGGGIEGWPLKRYLMSRSVNLYARWLLGLKPKDCSGGYRCYRVTKLAELDFDAMLSHGYSFQEEILWMLKRRGCRFGETPITFVDRVRGSSKINSREAWAAMWVILALGLKRVKAEG
jgi:dolichol-phosphate mannosyltransferase